ncbi:MAG: hypothetical protein ACOVOV_14230 [Dolichospermum sp.]|jgi:hypothetical protein
MTESKLITCGFCGFSFAQMIGILASGYGVYQSVILFFILCLICAIPGFIKYGILQRNMSSELKPHHIRSCFIPSLIGVSILTIGFLFGLFIGV